MNKIRKNGTIENSAADQGAGEFPLHYNLSVLPPDSIERPESNTGGDNIAPRSYFKSAAAKKAMLDLYDAALAQWPVAHQTIILETRYGPTHVIASGPESGPPLLLIHGLALNSTMWMGQAAAFSRRHRVYAVDIIGEPGKSAPYRPKQATGPAFGEWISGVLTGLEIDTADLMGISLGGWMALKVALYAPERVGRVVLLTPAGMVPPRRILAFGLWAIASQLAGRWGVERFKRYISSGSSRPLPAVMDELFSITLNPQFRITKRPPPLFSDEALRRLNNPALLLVGQNDALFSARLVVSRARRLLPNVTTEIIADGGHFLPADQPDLVLTRAERFLSE